MCPVNWAAAGSCHAHHRSKIWLCLPPKSGDGAEAMRRRPFGRLQFCGAATNPLHRDGLSQWRWRKTAKKVAVSCREQLRLAAACGREVAAQGSVVQSGGVRHGGQGGSLGGSHGG
ncbi:hypothetical protein COCNU_scaffold005319G000010 [Cocos nucifera]|nr:hypothetical protein [Cocos nucifera]